MADIVTPSDKPISIQAGLEAGQLSAQFSPYTRENFKYLSTPATGEDHLPPLSIAGGDASGTGQTFNPNGQSHEAPMKTIPMPLAPEKSPIQPQTQRGVPNTPWEAPQPNPALKSPNPVREAPQHGPVRENPNLRKELPQLLSPPVINPTPNYRSVAPEHHS
jgi:hypothetical protein